jgi:AcrR family transcriptional regulator
MGSTMSGSTKRTPSADVRTALVDAAEVVLLRDGPAGVTVRAVAREAGVAPMGVYNRFGSKEGLFDALLTKAFDGLAEAVRADGVDDPTDPRQRLRASGRNYRQFALAHPRQYALMFGPQPEREFSDELDQSGTSAFDELVNHVAAAQAAGVLRAGDPGALAHQVWCVVHGAVSLELYGQLPVDPEANYEALLDLVLRGLES